MSSENLSVVCRSGVVSLLLLLFFFPVLCVAAEDVYGDLLFDVTTPDVQAPNVTFVDDTPFNEVMVVSSFNVNVTANETVDGCLVDLNGSNYTLSLGASVNYIRAFSSMSNGNYTMLAYCNDSSSNLGVSSSRWVYVNYTAPDIDEPDGGLRPKVYHSLYVAFEPGVVNFTLIDEYGDVLFDGEVVDSFTMELEEGNYTMNVSADGLDGMIVAFGLFDDEEIDIVLERDVYQWLSVVAPVVIVIVLILLIAFPKTAGNLNVIITKKVKVVRKKVDRVVERSKRERSV